MYSTDIQDNGTVSATDEERLPPGGFSLRHGFPDWFGRRGRRVAADKQSGRDPATRQTPHRPPPPADLSSGGTVSSGNSALGQSPGFADTKRKDVSTFAVLQYIRSTFDDEDVMDSIPLEAAGNPGAWHAWRTHRIVNGKKFDIQATQTGPSGEAHSPSAANQASVRKPGEWNWEGVWEARVKKGISASLSEPIMFGGPNASDEVVSPHYMTTWDATNRAYTLCGSAYRCKTESLTGAQIHFLNMGEDDVRAIKDNLLRTVDHAPELFTI